LYVFNNVKFLWSDFVRNKLIYHCDLYIHFISIDKLVLPLYKTKNIEMSDGKIRKNIQVGVEVEVVQKHHQRTGELTQGIVGRILTKSPNHPHGIKVQLDSGVVGRVKNVLE